MQRYRIFLFLIVSIPIVIVSLLAANVPEPVQAVTNAPQSVDVILTPALVNLNNVGDEFSLTVRLEGSGDITGAGVRLDFDPQYLEALEITPLQSAFDEWFRRVDNEAGVVDYVAAIPPSGTPPSAPFNFYTVSWRVKQLTPGTLVQINRKSLDIPVPVGDIGDAMVVAGDWYFVYLPLISKQ